VYYIVRENDIR